MFPGTAPSITASTHRGFQTSCLTASLLFLAEAAVGISSLGELCQLSRFPGGHSKLNHAPVLPWQGYIGGKHFLLIFSISKLLDILLLVLVFVRQHVNNEEWHRTNQH